MKELLGGYSFDELPFKGLQKYSDLLEHDGPILSHFKDSKNRDILFYWVDYDGDVNRWLVWRINTAQLIQYLMGFKSLRDLLLENNKDFIYSVDIDNNLNHTNVKAFDTEQIFSEYIPEKSDLYIINPSEIYDNLLFGIEENAYVPSLRERALYYHIEPNNLKFSNTVSTSEAGSFLVNLTKSFRSFVAVNLFQNFKDKQGYSDLTETINRFKKILEPRIVALSYSSFNVGISTDTIHGPNDPQLKKWQKGVLEQFKKDVVNVDYSSDEALKSLSDKYSEEDRKQIYGPYIEIVNNSNLKVVVSDAKKNFRKTYEKLENRESLIPGAVRSVRNDTGKKLINVFLEVPENASIEEVNKKVIKEGILFSQVVDKVPIRIDRIEQGYSTIVFNEPIFYNLRLIDGYYLAESDDYGIEDVGGRTKELAQKAFEEKFIEQYELFSSSKAKSEMKTRYLKAVKAFSVP